MNREINIDLKRCLREVFRKWWIIAIIGVVFFVIAYLVSIKNSRGDEYTAEATVFSVTDYSALTLYSDIITSSKVCERAASLLRSPELNADAIKKMISVKTYSLVLGIHATSSNAEHAILVANAVANAFIEEVNNITSNNVARLLDKATNVELTYNMQLEHWKFRIVVTLAGIGLVCVWMMARVVFSRKVYNLSDIGLDGEIDVIGSIPLFQKGGRSNS